jgi:hypothetical protein
MKPGLCKSKLSCFSRPTALPTTACVYGGCDSEARPCPRGRNEVKERARQSQRSPAAAINTLLPPVRSPFVRSLLFQFGSFEKYTVFFVSYAVLMSKNLLVPDFSKYPLSPEKNSRFAGFIFLSHWGRGIFPRVTRNRVEFILENCERSTILKRHANSSADTFLSAYWRQREYLRSSGASEATPCPRHRTH